MHEIKYWREKKIFDQCVHIFLETALISRDELDNIVSTIVEI